MTFANLRQYMLMTPGYVECPVLRNWEDQWAPGQEASYLCQEASPGPPAARVTPPTTQTSSWIRNLQSQANCPQCSGHTCYSIADRMIHYTGLLRGVVMASLIRLTPSIFCSSMRDSPLISCCCNLHRGPVLWLVTYVISEAEEYKILSFW